MEDHTQAIPRKRSRRLWLWILGSVVLIGAAGFIYLTRNYNRLLSDALMESFNSNLASDVYELKFRGLDVNLVTGNIEVHDVELKPRAKPLNDYPYINSTFSLKTGKLMLSDVKIMKLLKEKRLEMEKVEIVEPDIQFRVNGRKYIFIPYPDTTDFQSKSPKNKKRLIESYHLSSFSLRNASIYVLNLAKKRELRIKGFNIENDDIFLEQKKGDDKVFNKKVAVSVGEMSWRLEQDAIRYISIKDYKLQLDSLDLFNNKDTSFFKFADFSTGLKELDMQTGDSLFHLTLKKFNLSYRDQAITLNGISFKPNISEAAMQRRFVYRTPVFSGEVGSIKLVGLNFDSLIFQNKIFIDELEINKAAVRIFTDQSKPVNMKKFPGYPGQQIAGIPIPIRIGLIKGNGLSLENREKTPKGGQGKVNLTNVNLQVRNFTNLSAAKPLFVSADAYVESKAHLKATMEFSYVQPAFTVHANVAKFNLPDLNSVLKSYTPAGVEKGVVDELDFTTHATNTGASGDMKFLFHDLSIDLELKDQAKWKSDLLSWTSNAVLSSSNPPSANKPAKEVKFSVERDRNKGFVNIIIKSLLAGFKETVYMSKENRKAYKEEKKLFRKNRKKQKTEE